MSKSKTADNHAPGMYWLCHHELIMEWVDDYDQRVAYIKSEKKPRERPRRLHWFRRVQGELPAELVRAARIARKHVDAFFRARQTSLHHLCSDRYRSDPSGYKRLCATETRLRRIAKRADTRYWNLLKKHKRRIVRLFRQECPGCPWNGKRLVFPGEVA